MDLKEQIIAEYLTQGCGFSLKAGNYKISTLWQASNVSSKHI